MISKNLNEIKDKNFMFAIKKIVTDIENQDQIQSDEQKNQTIYTSENNMQNEILQIEQMGKYFQDEIIKNSSFQKFNN